MGLIERIKDFMKNIKIKSNCCDGVVVEVNIPTDSKVSIDVDQNKIVHVHVDKKEEEKKED